MRIAASVGFPSAIFALEVRNFVGLRYLQERSIMSKAIWPARSPIARSLRGTALEKLFTDPILDHVRK